MVPPQMVYYGTMPAREPSPETNRTFEEGSTLPIKIMHTADVHIDTIRYGRDNPRTGLNYVVESNLSCLAFLVQVAIEREVDLFLLAGDLFTDANPQIEHLLRLEDVLQPLVNEGIPIAIDEGNHEYLYIKSQKWRSPASALAGLLGGKKDVHLSNSLDLTHYGAFDLLSIPYPDKATILADEGQTRIDPILGDGVVVRRVLRDMHTELENRDESVPLIITGHLTVDGIGLPGSERDVANHMNECVFPISSFEDLNPAYVGLGHIHTPQKVGEKTYYSGSPNKLTFTDYKDEKRGNLVTIHDDGSHEVESVFTPTRGLYIVDLEQDEFTLDLKENDVVKVLLKPGEVTLDPDIKKQFKDAHASPIVKRRPVPRPQRERVVMPQTISPEAALKQHLKNGGYSEDEITTLVAKAKTLGVGGTTK